MTDAKKVQLEGKHETRKNQLVNDASSFHHTRFGIRAYHPFLIRLKDTAGFSTRSEHSLESAGYASLAVGIYTIFRPTPALILWATVWFLDLKKITKVAVLCTLFVWAALVLFILFILGAFLVFSRRIKKRWVLILHPWGLLLMYFDMFVWIALTVILHFQVLAGVKVKYHIYPILILSIIYTEIILFGVLHYVYATYFIAAELTVIEKYF